MSQWKKQGISNKECAQRLGRNKSTIGREITRNRVKVRVGKDTETIYEPQHAQYVSESRKQNAWYAKQPLKNKDIYGYTMDHLRQGWSPEQIAGRLRYVEHPGDTNWKICHETIYQFVYKVKTDLTRQGFAAQSILDQRKQTDIKNVVCVTDHEKPLFEYLRRKQTRRRKISGRKVRRVRIPDRVSIHDRPMVVERRKQFGHWEGDSIVGLGHKSGLHTQYERVSSLTRFELLPRITADASCLAYERIFGLLPDCARRTVTFDNGSEHVKHRELTRLWGIQTYFADPYSSYQRGGNENANMWIRYYFPKGTDFNRISDEEFKDVEWELNNRPRKRLQYKTPQEVFNSYL